MKRASKLFSIFLAVLMVLSCMSMTVFAAKEKIEVSDYMNSNWFVYDHYSAQSSYTAADPRHPKQTMPHENCMGGGQVSTFADADASTSMKDFDNHIWVSGTGASTEALFVGYDRDAFADFILFDSKSDDKKVVAFDVDISQVFTHTLDGFGVLLNVTVDESKDDPEMSGYSLFYRMTSSSGGNVYLIEFNDLPMGAFSTASERNDMSGFFENGKTVEFANKFTATQLTSFSVASASSKIVHFELEIDETHLLATHTYYKTITEDGVTQEVLDDATAVTTYDNSLTKYGKGFGMLVDYVGPGDGHHCGQLSRVKFLNLQMMLGYNVNYVRNWNSDGATLTTLAVDEENDPGSTYTVNAIVGTTPVAQDDTYEFLGWGDAAKKDDVKTWYKPGDSFTINKLTNIYAVWQKKAAGLNFNPDGGTWPDGSTTTKNVTKEMGDPIVAVDNPGVPDKPNYVADGWIYDDGTKVVFDGSQKLDKPSVTVKPDWKEDWNGDGIADELQTHWPVTFEDALHGTVTGDKNFTVIENGSKKTDTVHNPDKLGNAIEIKKDGAKLPTAKADPGYNFKGWSVNGSTALIQDADLPDEMISGPTTIKPVYWPEAEIIIKDGPGGSLDGSDRNATVEDENEGNLKLPPAFVVPTPVPDRGNDFKGWDTDGDGDVDIPASDNLKDHIFDPGQTIVTPVYDNDNSGANDYYEITFIELNGDETIVDVPAGQNVATGTPAIPTITGNWKGSDGKTYTPAQAAAYVPTTDMTFTEVKAPAIPQPPKRR